MTFIFIILLVMYSIVEISFNDPTNMVMKSPPILQDLQPQTHEGADGG